MQAGDVWGWEVWGAGQGYMLYVQSVGYALRLVVASRAVASVRLLSSPVWLSIGVPYGTRGITCSITVARVKQACGNNLLHARCTTVLSSRHGGNWAARM